jgi:hypothetical protein
MGLYETSHAAHMVLSETNNVTGNIVGTGESLWLKGISSPKSSDLSGRRKNYRSGQTGDGPGLFAFAVNVPGEKPGNERELLCCP